MDFVETNKSGSYLKQNRNCMVLTIPLRQWHNFKFRAPQDLKNRLPIPSGAIWLENGPFWAPFCLGLLQLWALWPHSYATGHCTSIQISSPICANVNKYNNIILLRFPIIYIQFRMFDLKSLLGQFGSNQNSKLMKTIL